METYKLYFESISPLSTSMFCLVHCIGVVAMLKLSKKNIGNDLATGLIIFSFQFLYPVVMMLDAGFDFLPFSPDSSTYTVFVRDGTYVGVISHGYTGFLWIIRVLRILCFANPFVFISIQLLSYGAATLLLWKSFRVLNGNVVTLNAQRSFFALAYIYPAAIMFIPIPLRESLFLLFFAVFLLGYAEIGTKKGKLLIVIGMAGSVLLRPIFLVIEVLCLLLRKKHLSVGSIVAYSLFGVFFFIVVGRIVQLSTGGFTITPQSLSSLRDYNVNAFMDSDNTYGKVSWTSYFDVIRDLPVFCAQFLLAPLPILTKKSPFLAKLLLIDAAFIIGLFFIILLRLRSCLSSQWLLIRVFLAIVIVSSLYEFYLYDAARHRIPAILLLILVTSYSIGELHRRKRPERTPAENIV